MNRTVTSGEELLGAAREIAHSEGLGGVNIRKVASRCGDSVGSIYNYFPTKADLLLAVIEDFWHGAFHGVDWAVQPGEPFEQFFGRVYRQFYSYLSAFESSWLREISALSPQERKQGKAMEGACFRHIQRGLLGVLQADGTISPQVWGEGFTQEDFIAFVFTQMLALLKNGQEDCAFFQEVLRRLLRKG